MSELLRAILWSAAGYLAGSVPFGYIIVRAARGIDIRTVGSGNIGATNVSRVAGGRLAAIVFVLDALKGWLPVFASGYAKAGSAAAIATGICAILGHSFPCFLRGRGGKGVATGFGVALALAPSAALGSLIVWLACTIASGYVSFGSIAAAAAFPALVAWTHAGDPWKISFASIAAIFIIIMHRSNISRLLSGTENRIKTPWSARRR